MGTIIDVGCGPVSGNKPFNFIDNHSKIDKLPENQYPTHFSISINRPYRKKPLQRGIKGCGGWDP